MIRNAPALGAFYYTPGSSACRQARDKSLVWYDGVDMAKKRWSKLVRRLFLGIFTAGFFGAAALAAVFFAVARDLPSPNLVEQPRVAESTKIFDRTGAVLLYEIHGDEKRTVVSFAEIPERVKQATLAVEDAGFYSHPAFDWRAILRAALKNLRAGSVTQGGSTITQQLAKNMFLTPERTFSRKLKELILAARLERRFSKDEILNLYLNQIPYGSTVYGIESAAQTYLGKSVKDLSLAEAAALASIPRAPSYYSPWGTHVDELLARKDGALRTMNELGFIAVDEEEKAKKEPLVFRPPETGMRAPHFVMAVQEYLSRRYGEEFVRTGGLKVTTALDWDLQEIAERVVAEGAARNEELYQGKNAALLAEEADTGEVLAMVGSRDYFDREREGNFNVAAQGLRQPGSALKPFVYLAAFQKGYTPETVLFDLETEFDTTGNPEKSYRPQNFDERFRGPVRMRDALAQSINLPAVKTLYLVGLPEILKLVKLLGIGTLTERSRFGLSLVLGGGEVRLTELVHAYAALAQDGVRRPQTLIRRVETKDGVLEEYSDRPERVLEAQPVRLINNILSDVSARSPLFQNSLALTVFPDREVALKTGTTNDYRDAWAIGYTPSLVVGVWAGNNDNQPMQRRGGSILAAVPIWSKFMKEALKNRPAEFFEKPELAAASKPVLRGDYLVTYEANGAVYPQVHDILFYTNRSDPAGPEPERPEEDPQFAQWEGPVLAWAAANVPNFAAYNQPLPPGSVPAFSRLGNAGAFSIRWMKPLSGDFVDNVFEIDAEVVSPNPIASLELVLNGAVIERRSGGGEKNIRYRTVLHIPAMKLQNSLELKAADQGGVVAEGRIVLYRRTGG